MSELLVVERVKRYVKDYLKKTGKLQSFVAEEIGFDPKRFSSMINGRASMGIADLAKICIYFNEPASTFIILNNPMESDTHLPEQKPAS